MTCKLALFLSLFLVAAFEGLAAYPDKPIKIIVPTNAGGEIDAMARIFQRAFQEKDLLPVKAVVVNMPGAGGTVGTRRLKESPPDGYTIGLWAPGIVTSKAMGIVNFDHKDFEVLGTTGYSEIGFGVKDDAPFQTIEELIAAAKAKPNSIKVATNIGLPVHFFPFLFAEEAGIELKFVQSGGGSVRLASILGRHNDMAMFSLLAFKQFKKSGLKPLVILSGERHELFPDIPTAKEIGVDLEITDTRIWLAPKGTPPERLEIISNVIKTTIEAEDVREEFISLGLTPEFGSAEKLEIFLDDVTKRITPLVAKMRKNR